MPGFKGKYYNSVDSKGRVMIPAVFRSVLNDNYSTALVVTLSAFEEGCLEVFPVEEWEKFENRIRELPSYEPSVQYIKRRVIASAHDCELDKHGRLLIPASLRDDASIDGEAVVVGQIDRISIWNKKKWDEVNTIDEDRKMAFMRQLADLGL